MGIVTRFYAGVDGGQSSTQAVIGDERGTVLGRGVAPSADLVGEARDSQRQAHRIDAALSAARHEAGLSEETELAGVVCGLSGFDEGEPVPELRTAARRVRIVHDAEIALAGALDGAPGIVVIAGTGSVALGIDGEGRRARVGGWGYLFGDEGSAFWIARRALSTAMRREDRGERSRLKEQALASFSLPSLRAVQHAFAHGELSRAELAAFTPTVLELARGGDVDAHLLRSDAARALADFACAVDARLGTSSESRLISHAGGVFVDAALRETWREAILERLPKARIAAPQGEPVLGALRLARDESAHL